MKRLALGEALHFPTEFVKRIFTEGGAVASSFVQITFTEQQLDLLRRQAQAACKDVTSLVSEYLAKTDSTNLAPRHIRMGPGVGSQPTPDDVHDSCNFFMNTTWDAGGGPHWSEWNTAQPGDIVDLVACMDVLAVPIVCG